MDYTCTTNERGEKLIEWCKANDFTVTNTCFKNHPRRQWTWMSQGDRTRNKIDYILIQNRFRNSIKSSKSMPGADCDSDHAPVLCKLLVNLRKLKKPQLQTKFNIIKLKSDKELNDQFIIEVKNRFDGLVELTEEEELFEKK